MSLQLSSDLTAVERAALAAVMLSARFQDLLECLNAGPRKSMPKDAQYRNKVSLELTLAKGSNHFNYLRAASE